MKLVVPYIGALRPADARLIQLAEFLGIHSEALALSKGLSQYREFLDATASDEPLCCVVNPSVIQDWAEPDPLPAELVTGLMSKFAHLFVHAVRPDPFHSSVVAAFSGGTLGGVRQIGRTDVTYQISPNSRDICEAFAGLHFGPANLSNDRVFSTRDVNHELRTLISLGGNPFMAVVKHGNCNVFFIGSEDTADLTAEAGDAPLSDYFSRFLPHVMALRHIFGEECWRSEGEPHACVIVDDPLLRPAYGFLNFEHLLALMQRHNFHTTIAFIPHNFRRSSPRIIRMFRENPKHLSLCFHGNDHTRAEFAATDQILLNTMLQIAEKRMTRHGETTGLHCDRVMVFPQGKFSVEAMSILKSRNFDCAVNTVPHPMLEPARLTLGELAQPAVLRYGQFSLFLRKDSVRTQKVDIALNLFFGRPTLIVEHHDVFKSPERLIEAISRVNETAPEIRWANVGGAVKSSVLRQRNHDGAVRISAYSREVRVANTSDRSQSVVVGWRRPGNETPVEQVLENGLASKSVNVSNLEHVQLSAELDPMTSSTFGLIYKNDFTTLRGVGLHRTARGFVRRRLSEVRDNYFSKNSSILAVVKCLQQRFLG